MIQAERLQQIRQFLAEHQFKDAELHPLAGDASFRRYIRVQKLELTAMLMDAPPEKENIRPFIMIAENLYQQGFSAPHIIGSNIHTGLMLLEDLGDDSFSRVLKRADAQQMRAIEKELYTAAIDLLAEFHQKRQLPAHRLLTLSDYDETLLLKEVSLFSDWYLPQLVGMENAASLRTEYLALWQRIIEHASLATDTFVHRDYHADNLMWLPGRPGVKRVGLLDFQDAVFGDPAYDVVSLLEDARRDVPADLTEAMLKHYLHLTQIDHDQFMRAYAVLGAQRNSKIIGIFMRLAARDNKAHYLDYLPRVWAHLEHDLRHPALAELKHWLTRHVPAPARGKIPVRYTARDLALSA